MKYNYNKYTRSDVWKKRREEFYKKFGKICAKCQSTKYIQLHHKTYQNISNEQDDDLIPLCARCHKMFHRIFSRTSKQNTDDFLKYDLNKYEKYIKEVKIEKKIKKQRKRLNKKSEEITYKSGMKGKYKMLSKRSIRLIKRQALENIGFDCLKNRVKPKN